MKTPNLTYNILTFKHPQEEYTFYFSNEVDDELCRVHNSLVPDEVIKEFGEQEHYYTSFAEHKENFFPITKKSKPIYNSSLNEDGDEEWIKEANSAYSKSILKRSYNSLIHAYFQNKGLLVKPNFVSDIEIWKPLKTDAEYQYFEKHTIKVQIAKITKQPELLITYAGVSRVFRKSIADFMAYVDPSCFNWVIYHKKLFKFDELSEEAKQEYENAYPVWNFDLRDALEQETEAPDKSNKYIKFKSHIDKFYKEYLNTEEFKAIIPIDCKDFIDVRPIKINKVNESSNQLLFRNNQANIVPFLGMLKGPFKTSDYSNIQFFFIFHKEDKDVAISMDGFFSKGVHNFKGLYNFSKVPYFTVKNFSVVFEDKENPLPEIEKILRKRNFQSSVHYIAIYLSPHGKHVRNKEQKAIYYKVKELLLKKGITSQAIDAEKVRLAVKEDSRYDYSLNNIAIAILAKLDGIPWQLNTSLKNELIVGVGAFKNKDTDIQYIGSAFSFANNGKFNRFECFQKNQTDELAGSILNQIKEYVSVNSNMSRLIIHFYKNMSKEELEPIEQGLNHLGLDIPVFILSINKSESSDIVAFDKNWKGLMPESGIFINIGFNRFLLFNNTRYSINGTVKDSDGYPFPIKLGIRCTHKELEKDYIIIKELIDQVYQFSRMYWKSVRQQNLPVTIKYPEMVAEIFPHFDGNEIPTFGKDNLWFL